jgi:hypothetical protein
MATTRANESSSHARALVNRGGVRSRAAPYGGGTGAGTVKRRPKEMSERSRGRRGVKESNADPRAWVQARTRLHVMETSRRRLDLLAFGLALVLVSSATIAFISQRNGAAVTMCVMFVTGLLGVGTRTRCRSVPHRHLGTRRVRRRSAARHSTHPKHEQLRGGHLLRQLWGCRRHRIRRGRGGIAAARSGPLTPQ